jgi:signal transduction histidine kinase
MIRPLREPIRRLVVDWFAPLVILGIGVVNLAGHAHSTEYPGSPAVHAAFLVPSVVALGLRRRAPLVAPFAAVALVTGWSLLWPSDAQGPFEGFLVLVGAAYAVGALNRGRRLVAGGVALAAYFLVGQVVILAYGGRDGDLLPLLVWLAVGWAVGVLISWRTRDAHDARQLAMVATVDQERRTAEAVEQERARIARELHDVVAHSLSVIVVQAAAERRALGHGAVDVESLDTVLGAVERTGREALVDLRRLLGLLRRTDEPPSLAPQPSLADLETLVRPVRDAGVEVHVEEHGAPFDLPPAVDLTAYRIVQEALTNVLKHAAARHVDVLIGYYRNHVELTVHDDGGPAGDAVLSSLGAGFGLAGMQERVSVFGGTISAGRQASGGWSVSARLPISPATTEGQAS